jgi:beta-glucanase (GH16 family)
VSGRLGVSTRARRLGWVIVAVLAAVPLPPTSAADAAPAPGWRLTWATDFSGSALPSQCASYGGPYDGGASYWLADEVTVSGGLLRLGIQRRDHGGKAYTTGGVACYKVAQTYGRYEWRARVPPGKGIDSYAALWPIKNTPNQATLAEILGVPGHEVMAVTNEYGSGSTGEHIAGTYAGAFHTYVIEWTPTRFRLLVDGVPRFTSAQVSKVSKSINFAVSNGDVFTGLPDAATTLPAEFQVDRLSVYGYVPGTAAPTGGSGSTTSAATPTPATAPGANQATATASTGPPVPSLAADHPGPSRPSRPPWGWWAVGVLVVALIAGGVRRTGIPAETPL